MTQHTQGTWDVTTFGRWDPAVIWSDKECIARVNSQDKRGEGEANAHLMAAAPELLGACLSALRALKDNLNLGHDAIKALEQAIAKAKGDPE